MKKHRDDRPTLNEASHEGSVAGHRRGLNFVLVQISSHSLVVRADQRIVLVDASSMDGIEAEKTSSISRFVIEPNSSSVSQHHHNGKNTSPEHSHNLVGVVLIPGTFSGRVGDVC
jgi:hypothetical protein